MTDFQDLDILSLINERPGWEIDMQDDDDLDITGELDEENHIPNCFANDEGVKNQPYTNSAMGSFNSSAQGTGDATDEYGDNSDGSDDESNGNDSNKLNSDDEEEDESDDNKNVCYTSDEEDAGESDDDKINDRVNSDNEEGADELDDDHNNTKINSDEEEEGDFEDAKSQEMNNSDEEEEDDSDDDKSIISKGNSEDIQEQQKDNDQFSDISETDFAILDSDTEEVREGSNVEATKDDGEENDLYDTNDVIVVKLSDISDDESEKDDYLTDNENNHSDAGCNDDDDSVHGNDGDVSDKDDDDSISGIDKVELNTVGDENEIESDKLSDLSMDVVAEESGDDEDMGSEDEKVSIIDDHDGDGDVEWSDADENDNTNDVINSEVSDKENNANVYELVDSGKECSKSSFGENNSSVRDEHMSEGPLPCTPQTEENDTKPEKDVSNEESDSPFGFVIGDVVGVSQEEFDRQDSNMSSDRDKLRQQQNHRESAEENQDNEGNGNRSITQPLEEKRTKDVEMTTPSVYPRVESYHSDNYLFGNAQIKQEPMDDDDYIQEHDYFDQSSMLNIEDFDNDEVGLEAGELLTYQDMFDITATGLYKCKYCSAKLTTFKSLKMHIDKCHQKSYKCQQCDAVFSRSQDLAGHCRTHRKEERILKEGKTKKGKGGYIALCKPRARSSRSKNIVVEKDGQRLYRCRFCKKKFDMTQKLANHMQWSHKAEREREVKLEKIPDENIAVTQVSLCGAKMIIKMDSSNKDVPQRKTPVYHDTYRCSHCPEIFNKQQAMAVHVKNHHTKHDKSKGNEKSPGSIKKKSKKKSKRKRRLSTFCDDIKIKEDHDGYDTCSTLEEAVSPAKQIKLEYTVQRQSLKCKLCSKTFQEARELKSHLNGVHAQYCCRYCPKAFYKVEKFMCHSFQHLGDFRCFVDENGEPMLRCRKCKATILPKGEMTLKHVIGHIKGKNPAGQALSLEKQIFLECSVCGQPFTSREFLLRHELKHARSSGKVVNQKSVTRPTTDNVSQASANYVSQATANVKTSSSAINSSQLIGCQGSVDTLTFVNPKIPANTTTVTSQSEMVAHPMSDPTNTNVGLNNSKADDNKKVLLRSQVIHTELISVTKIPFKCGMCEARFPNSQYLLHHMTLHMNGQYVFKIEVDKKKDELSKGNESSETDIPSSKTTNPPVEQPSSGNEMASSIVQQLSKGSNMASIISSNISPESGVLFNSSDSSSDHTYTSKVIQSPPSSSENPTSKPSVCPVVTIPSSSTPPVRKKFIILPTRPVMSIPTTTTQTPVTPTTTKKLQEMLSKKDQPPGKTVLPNLEVFRLPSLASITPNRREDGGADPIVVKAVESKIRELLENHKGPSAKPTPSSIGVQTKYTSLIYPKTAMLQKSTDSAGPTMSSLLQSPEDAKNAVTTANETTTSKPSTAIGSFDVHNVNAGMRDSSEKPSTRSVGEQYSDTETLSADSGSPDTRSPGSQSPVVGMSSDSDSDELSEDEQALFEETTMSVSLPLPAVEKSMEMVHELKTTKKEVVSHSSLPKVSIKNYKNQLDFAHGSWFECELCMYLCRTHKEFTTHLDSHKKAKKMKLVKCSVCLRKFISKWHLSKHLEVHRENAYSCSKCGANFRTSVAVMEHMQKCC
ncbi:uncharacterized protein LOC117314675 [Pecten maximus]|uniref:uncharacterized protein LOC117314675 n=1 Tax=Pecten maximus TaxID=6579 RepID=UPI001458BD8B|nr:uncharacterized protein LOC117314675 [Pecten maximus]